MMKQTLKRILAATGYEIRRKKLHENRKLDPVEFSKADREILNYVKGNRLTMARRERVIATIKACKHAVEAGVEGDFVECGVWRGGNALAAKLTFENYGSDKKVWMFDTFTGMTAPTEADTSIYVEKSALDRFQDAQKTTHTDWCFASLDDVRVNFEKAGADLTGVRFIAGDVIETLCDQANLPARISVLRLDTDWYESTKAELEVLYPRLSFGGSLLIDDFGHWDGARRAVEEYLEMLPPRSRPLLHFTDYSGRMGVKVV